MKATKITVFAVIALQAMQILSSWAACETDYNMSFKLDGNGSKTIPEAGRDYCGGSGPTKIVPEGVLGANFRTACATHDTCYDRAGVNALGAAYNYHYMGKKVTPDTNPTILRMDLLARSGFNGSMYFDRQVKSCNDEFLKRLNDECAKLPTNYSASELKKSAVKLLNRGACLSTSKLYYDAVNAAAKLFLTPIILDESACMAKDLIRRASSDTNKVSNSIFVGLNPKKNLKKGELYEFTFNIKNAGSTTWTSKFRLAACNGCDSGNLIQSISNISEGVGYLVQPGQAYQFKVKFICGPSCRAKLGLNTVELQMKDQNGSFFGPKFRADITLEEVKSGGGGGGGMRPMRAY